VKPGAPFLQHCDIVLHICSNVPIKRFQAPHQHIALFLRSSPQKSHCSRAQDDCKILKANVWRRSSGHQGYRSPPGRAATRGPPLHRVAQGRHSDRRTESHPRGRHANLDNLGTQRHGFCGMLTSRSASARSKIPQLGLGSQWRVSNRSHGYHRAIVAEDAWQ